MIVHERIVQLIRLRRELVLLEHKYSEALVQISPIDSLENAIQDLVWKLDVMLHDLHEMKERPVAGPRLVIG